MTGLDRILSQIGYEAKVSAEAILADAQKQADAMLQEAEEQGRAEARRITQQSAADVKDALARSESAAALQKRKAVLAAKQEMINDLLEQALASLSTLPDSEYFALIAKMAPKYALPQPGEVLFSAKDLGRLPQGLESKLNEALAKGAKLTVSGQTRPIDGGFVLNYGGVEENCSFTALFDAAHEALLDRVHELLFS